MSPRSAVDPANDAYLRRELEELFDHRRDGVAASRRFEEFLAWYAVVIGDGTVRTARGTILHDLVQAERRIERATLKKMAGNVSRGTETSP